MTDYVEGQLWLVATEDTEQLAKEFGFEVLLVSGLAKSPSGQAYLCTTTGPGVGLITERLDALSSALPRGQILRRVVARVVVDTRL